MFNKFCFMNPPRTHEIADCRFRWDPWGPWDPRNFMFFFFERSFDPGESLQLMCPQGHLINKRKLGRFSGGFWLFLQCKTHQISSNTIENPFSNSLKKLPICASIISNHWHPSKKRDEKQSRVPAIPRPKEPTSGTLHSEDSSIWQTDSATKTPIKQLKQSAISFWLTK